MGDSLITIVAIFLAAILMFVFPLATISEMNDNEALAMIQSYTTEFVNKIRTKGKITRDDYNAYVQKLHATGNSYDVDFKVQIADTNPGKKTENQQIGDTTYYGVYTSQVENELNQLYEKLRTAKIFPEQKFETDISKTSSNISQEYGSSGYSAIDAQDKARERFYGMSKFKRTVAKITGKKKKFEALANKAYDSMTPQEEQALANEIGKMFR